MANFPEVPQPDSTRLSAQVPDPTIEMLDVDAAPRRSRLPKVLGVFVLVAFLAFAGLTIYAQRQFAAVEKLDLGGVLSPSSPWGTNYLIVGSDSRENLDRNVENAGAIFGDGTENIAGQRTDTIQILRISDDGTQHILALPRDLYVPMGGNGSHDRINAAYAYGGAELLISTIQGSLGIPVHHYAEIDFAGFIDLVDAAGGVTIDFPYPAYDDKTGLNVTEAGPAKLDSTQALAFVRSRNYTEVIDGQAIVDRRGDLGRVKRQQVFLQALFGALGGVPNLVSALPELGGSAGSFKVDSNLSFANALSLAGDLRSFEPNTEWDLVVANVRVASGAQVLQLDSVASQSTLEFFSR